MQQRKCRLIGTLVILAVALYAIVTIAVLQPKINRLRDDADGLTQKIAELEERNGELRTDIAALGSDAATEKLARERLMMIADGETVYIDSNR